MSKKLSLILGLVLSVGLFSACSNGADTTEKTEEKTETKVEEKVDENKEESKETEDSKEKEDGSKEEDKQASNAEITFWHAMGAGQGEALEALIKKFEDENPNIKVNLQNQGNYKDLNQKLVATMQSPKELPTITQAYPDWMLEFSDANLVTDLTSMVKGEDGIDDYDDILPGIREEIEKDGKIVGLPFNKSTEVFWYNKDLFDELKLEVPTTFEQLKEVSKKIYEEKGIPGVGFDALSNYYATYLKTKGSDMDANLDVASDESVEAVNYYLDGIKEGYFRIAGTDQYMSGPFANEQVGAYIGSNAGEVYVKDGVAGKFEYAAAPYPAEKAVQQGTNLYLFDNADDNQKQAAFKLLKYLSSKDAQIEFALATGYMPARKSAVEDDKYKSSDSKIAPILAESSEKLFSRPLAPGSQQAYNDMASTLETILSNPESDAKAELENFSAQYKSDFEAK